MRRRARFSQGNLTRIRVPGPPRSRPVKHRSRQLQILRVLKESRSNRMPISVCLVQSLCDTTAEIKEQAYSILRKSSQHSTVNTMLLLAIWSVHGTKIQLTWRNEPRCTGVWGTTFRERTKRSHCEYFSCSYSYRSQLNYECLTTTLRVIQPL
ncbi:hypothetical protein BD309DRAFT_99380 [Dichomitus squalens]|nr:hypothetical protein BD309DRAFT_99380 [Dichomitus squalens]